MFTILLILLNFSFVVHAEKTKPGPAADWEKSLLTHREQKNEEFKNSPTSPMAGTKRLSVKPGQNTFVVEKEGDITLSPRQNTAAKFSLSGKKGKWRWQALSTKVTCRSGEKEIKSGFLLPGYVKFKVGRFTLAAYVSGEKLALLVFDRQRPEIKKFSHLLYFPPDRKFAVQAKLERLLSLERVTVLTSRNLEKTYYRYAEIHFKLDGKTVQLTAFKFTLQGPNADILFVPFMDGTSGKETYGGGRFLEIPEPVGDTFVLDFNLCFNPLCNYASVYNCPIPPKGNFLDAPVNAGEKTYPH